MGRLRLCISAGLVLFIIEVVPIPFPLFMIPSGVISEDELKNPLNVGVSVLPTGVPLLRRNSIESRPDPTFGFYIADTAPRVETGKTKLRLVIARPGNDVVQGSCLVEVTFSVCVAVLRTGVLLVRTLVLASPTRSSPRPPAPPSA